MEEKREPRLSSDAAVDDILAWYNADESGKMPDTPAPQPAVEAEKSEPAAAKPAAEKPAAEKKKKKQSSLLLDLAALLLKIAWIGLFFAVMLVYVVGITSNSGNRMAPAFQDRDIIVYYRLDKEFEAGECVVYLGEDGSTLVGRVIASDGDTVDITPDGLTINGYYQTEPYITGETVLFEGGPSFPMTLNDGEYFILCDKRSEGGDSRTLGALSGDEIKGRVMLLIRNRDF